MRRLEHLRLILEINILTNYITLLSLKFYFYIIHLPPPYPPSRTGGGSATRARPLGLGSVVPRWGDPVCLGAGGFSMAA